MRCKQIKIIFCSLIALMLVACNNQNIKEGDSHKQDLFEVEALASKSYENNDWLESEKHYTILVEKIPENAVHWFRLGNIYARTQRPDAAVAAYREALLRDPKYAKAWYNLGVLHLQQAANSFGEFEIYVDKDDPLYGKGQKVFAETLNIIQGTTGK